MVKIVEKTYLKENASNKESKINYDFDNLDYNIKYNLLKYTTLRVDLKNFGSMNDVEILDISDENATVRKPDWLSNDEGKGLILQSYKGFIKFKVKCINDGTLRITLRGIDFRDSNRDRFPVYVNINNLKINDEIIIENNLVWHSEPYIFKKEVKDSEILELNIEWSPIDKYSIFENTPKLKIEELRSNASRLKKQLNSSSKKVKSLSNEIEKIKDENYNLKITLEKIARENYELKNQSNLK